MKKKQVVASLLVAVSVLGTSPLAALAEEGKVTSPVDVVVPSPSDNEKVPVPTEKEEKPKDDKTQTGEVTPETPVNPTIPDKSGENQESVKPTEPSKNEEKKEEPTPSQEEKKEEKPAETPKADEATKPITPTPEEKKAEENTGVKATDTPKQTNVTEEQIEQQPIVTNTGHTVVGTKEGQVYVQNPDGAVELKNAYEIGAVKQQDGTVALKDEKGELKVLPKTGTVASLALSLTGVLMLAGVALLKKFNKASR
ncbi:LPXTG cell wall anchor domain-containing protein [Streptococcus anginosus]|uniref:LPXTG cell wall anchor domain-containing protein n=1 Tax=Streptococcus anginosus TaxID=1328 RepID=UPI000C799AFF|nr:LPXTG cell wall anchor domain-containing protein [Streptococcus anginosus]KAA9228421.1 LPXTG cell wall anchor domain-containing protein [Streptococcus anginosus]KAA9247703.1 LPXTG cell wall anchor domain-containing protein [Streptococcus anginosus]KAA9291354.1 LPXTG cell wall anchor domain-containing protein [Streptococcus anginosus]MCW1020884.1 LPXTG cell wall anchor domain-containing protein [Streptococcus anginosus]MCW1022926.1 LPXTG cell wall anchor domain-containing protein [Streptococ